MITSRGDIYVWLRHAFSSDPIAQAIYFSLKNQWTIIGLLIASY